MIGYHYTTYSNWQKIKKEGLKPGPVTDYEVVSLVGETPQAIWFYTRNQEGFSHVGNVLLMAIKKQEMHVVKLKCTFNKEALYKTKYGQNVELTHEGLLGTEYYFHRNEPAVLVVKEVPPSKIKLMGVWDISEKLKEND